jgi:plastocyanin
MVSMDQPTLIPRPRTSIVALAIACAVALSACGSSSHTNSKAAPVTTAAPSSAPAASGHVEVAIKNYAFKPVDLTVKAGSKVTFANDDQTAHTATSKTSGVFDTGAIQPGKSATVTLSKPGTYTYYCQFHAFMTAKITVK